MNHEDQATLDRRRRKELAERIMIRPDQRHELRTDGEAPRTIEPYVEIKGGNPFRGLFSRVRNKAS